MAILHSFAMAHQRNGTSTDQAVWNISRISRYWEKDILIIPVHQPMKDHWTMAVVYFRKRHIVYFDSFGSSNNRAGWVAELKVRRIMLVSFG